MTGMFPLIFFQGWPDYLINRKFKKSTLIYTRARDTRRSMPHKANSQETWNKVQAGQEITDSGHNLPIAENIPEQNFEVTEPNKGLTINNIYFSLVGVGHIV